MQKKSELKHFVANLLTILSLEFLSSNKDKFNKRKLKKIIKIASLINIYEEIFLGEKPTLFLQETDLNDLMELAVETMGYKKSKVTLNSPEIPTLKVKVDKNIMIEALKFLIEFLSNEGKDCISIQVTKKGITINLEKPSSLDNLNTKDLINCLHTNNIQNNIITFSFAKKILELHQIKFSIQKQRTQILLKFI